MSLKSSGSMTIVITTLLLTSLLMASIPSGAESGGRSADVSVTAIDVSASLLFVGDNFTIVATITNYGDTNATDVTVGFEAWNISNTHLVDIGQVLVGSDNGGQDIAPGGLVNVSIAWNTSEVGKEVQAGVFQINVTANNATDANGTNATHIMQVEFLDMDYLEITYYSPSATEVMVGDPFNITYTVTNIGSKDQAGPETLNLYLDDSALPFAAKDLLAISSKESRQGVFDIDTSEYTLGNHSLLLKLQNAGRSVRTDNITFTFPNVFVGEMEWTPFNGTVGDIIVVNATIVNNGTADANDIYVGFYVDFPYVYEEFNTTVNVTAGGTNVSSFEWNTSGRAAGNHTVKALVPSWSSSNVTGNITLEAGGVADLAITDLVLDPDTVDIGEEVNINATIVNVGDWPSGPTNVSFRQVKGLESTPIGLVDIPGLGIGQSTEASLIWDTSGLEFWNYVVWAQVDPEGYVDEEILTNNKANATLTLKGKPDLAVVDINITVGQVEVVNISQGETATVNMQVFNQGTKSSEPTLAALYLDGSATPVRTMKIFGLAVGGHYNLTHTWDTSAVTVGSHSLTVKVDIDGNNTEINETNNEMTLQVNIHEPPGTVDLMVTAVSVEPRSPKVGDHIKVKATVKNNGTVDAINVTVLFSRVAPGGNIEIGREVVETIEGGGSVDVEILWTTGTMVQGNYNLNITVDPLNQIRETDLSNNHMTYPVTLSSSGSGGTPNLVITELSIAPKRPEKDEKATITVVITNKGTGNASNVRVVLFIDDKQVEEKTIGHIEKNGGTASEAFTWKAKEGKHLMMVKVFLGTSPVEDDLSSKMVNSKAPAQAQLEDYLPFLIIIIVLVIIAIGLMAAGGREGKPVGAGKGGFVEDEDEDDYPDEEE